MSNHIFFVGNDISESPGLERILMFYNIITFSKNTATEELLNNSTNVLVAEGIDDPQLKIFVEKLSYGTKPIIISDSSEIILKLSKYNDWDYLDISNYGIDHVSNAPINFSVYKYNDKITVGNIYRRFQFDLYDYNITVLDWTMDYINTVTEFVKQTNFDNNSHFLVEAKYENNHIIPIYTHTNKISEGTNVYTRIEILENNIPLFLQLLNQKINNHELFDFQKEFENSAYHNQKKAYLASKVVIRSKYETVIKNDLISGIYKYCGDNAIAEDPKPIKIYEIDEDGDKTLCLMGKGDSYYDIADGHGFIINTKEKNTKLINNDVFATLLIPATALDSREKLLGWISEVIKVIILQQTK